MKKSFQIIFLSLITLFAACKKDKIEVVEPEELKGSFKLEFDHVWGSHDNTLALNSPYVLLNGTDTVRFSRIKYYISNVMLQKTDNSWYSVPESYYLVDASSASTSIVTINDIPKAEYKSVKFLIGVDSTRNVSGAQSGALSVTNNMFWSWSTGYIFIKLEGLSNQAMGGSFTYHIGGFSGVNNALIEKNFDLSSSILSIKPGAVPQAHFMVDLSQVWKNDISLSSTPMVHMPGANAKKVAQNFASGLELDHIHN
jgi:hypothetical protein